MLLCFIIVTFCMQSVFAEDSVIERPGIKVEVNGRAITFSDVTISVNGRTLLPLRALLSNLDVPNDDQHIIWNSSEKSVTVVKDSTKIYLKAGSNIANVNNSSITLDAPLMIYSKNGRTYIPARFVAQSLGLNVDWDAGTNTVKINSKAGNEQAPKAKMYIEVIPQLIDGKQTNIVSKIADNVTVRTGVNMDLLFAAAETGGNFREPMGYLLNNDQYGINDKVKSYFEKYSNNASAVDIYQSAMKVDNPPHKFVNPILGEVLTYDDGTAFDPADKSVWDTLRKFASDTNASQFFKDNRVLYVQMVQDFVQNNLNFNHVQRLQEFFGKDLGKDKFVIVLSTVMNGGQANFVNYTDGSTIYYNIMNPTDSSGVLNTLYHETAHNFYDVRLENKDLIDKYSQYANSLGHHESDFGTELNETIARVVTAVMLDKYHGKQAADDNLNWVSGQGWKNTREIYTLVENKYLTNRDKYKTFKDFVPVIFEYLKASSTNEHFDIGNGN